MHSRFWLTAFCVLLAPAGTAATRTFKDSVQPFLKSHCTFCHNDELKTADLSFDHYQDERSALKDAQVWRRVKHLLDRGMMPPSPQPRPAPEEVAAFLDCLFLSMLDRMGIPTETLGDSTSKLEHLSDIG